MKKKKIKAKPTKKQWGFLAYIAADNDLTEYGLQDIKELCEVGASEQVHVGVEIDTYGEHEGSIRYEITEPDWNGDAHRTVIERLPEKDSGDPETLRSFLKWGLERYPAENHLVVVWNHGTGFRSVRRDIGYDDFGSSLDMPEIEDVFKRSGIGPKNKIAVLGFDACLMNMIEIANHFRDEVEILVGSQQTEPGDGWPYDKILGVVNEAPDRIDLAKRIVEKYIRDYGQKGIFDVTQSAVDLSKTDPAVKALNELGDLLVENFDKYEKRIRKIRQLSQTFEMADYIDLIHMAELFSKRIKNDPIVKAAKLVIEAASACILASDTLGPTVKSAHGLSVWFPAYQSLYYDYRAKYLALKCNKEGSGWVSFLDTYHY